MNNNIASYEYIEKLKKLTPNLTSSPYSQEYFIKKIVDIVRSSTLSESQKLYSIKEILEDFEE